MQKCPYCIYAYVTVKEIQNFEERLTCLRSLLFYGVVLNATRGLLGKKMSLSRGVKSVLFQGMQKIIENETFARPSTTLTIISSGHKLNYLETFYVAEM